MNFIWVFDENGNHLRFIFDMNDLLPGETAFDHQPTEEELIATFPNYVPLVWRAVQSLARSALMTSDGVAVRCLKANVPFPPDWWAYVESLRAIVRTHSGDPNLVLPDHPPYPDESQT